MTTSKTKGFTLIEVMITIIIIAILASIATAAYRGYITKARRQAMEEDLLTMQQEAEEYYSLNHKYAGAFGSGAGTATVDGRNPFYAVTYCTSGCSASGNENIHGGYVITATAQKSQESDTECKVLQVYRNGTRLAKDSNGNASEGCW